MAVEKMNGGEYYKYTFMIADFDIHSAAICSFTWYITELNRGWIQEGTSVNRRSFLILIIIRLMMRRPKL